MYIVKPCLMNFSQLGWLDLAAVVMDIVLFPILGDRCENHPFFDIERLDQFWDAGYQCFNEDGVLLLHRSCLCWRNHSIDDKCNKIRDTDSESV